MQAQFMHFLNHPNGWIDTTENQKILPATYFNNAANSYGVSVAVDGDITVVGAPGQIVGAAYVLEFKNNTWTTLAELSPSDGYNRNYFGTAVSIHGDYIVVGSPRHDYQGNGNSSSGAAYVYKKPDSGWEDMTETAKLIPHYHTNGHQLGHSVDIYNDHIVVGSHDTQGGYSRSGAAYVFSKSARGWVDTTQTAVLLPSNPVREGYFGKSVSIHGDNIVIGAENTSSSIPKTAYVFTKSDSGWADSYETAQLTPSDIYAQRHFASSVDIWEDNIVVGSKNDYQKGYYAGAAYIYVKPSSGWNDMTETTKILPADSAERHNFGHSVSVYKDTVAIGASNSAGSSDGGAAYIFHKPATGWKSLSTPIKLSASDSAAGDFGSSISIHNNHVVVGAPYTTNNGEHSAGTAYLFRKCSNTRSTFSIATCINYKVPSGDETHSVIGSYTVHDTIPNSGCGDSIMTIYLTILPVIDTTLNVNSMPELISNHPGAKYQWINCLDNTNLLGDTLQTFHALIPGLYAVEISNGTCIDTSECINVITVGTNSNLAVTPVSIYPNPSSKIINIDLGNRKFATIKIIDAQGKIIDVVRHTEGGIYALNINSKGIFFIEVYGNQDLNRFKILIQ